MLLFTALLALSVNTDFEGSSIGKVERVSEAHLRIAVKGESDQDGRNRQANWYYFRVDGAKTNSPLDIDIVNLPGEYNYQPNRGAITGDTPPVISYDRVEWTHISTYEYDAAEPKLRLHVRPRRPTFWIAHCPPYTNENLSKLRTSIAASADFRKEVVGRSAGGRELLLWTIGRGDPARVPVIWLMFRQHSWESGSSWAGEGVVRQLLGTSSDSKLLRERALWKIFPLCDPDGVARGGVRFNVNGFDLNRNWDVVNRERMPEITAQRDAVRKWIEGGHRIALFLSLHNTETSEYLEGPPGNGGEGKFTSLAGKFFEALKTRTTFDPSRPLFYATETTTPGKPGRMTVIQGLYSEFGIPGFLMEQRIANNPKLGHLPGIADRLAFGSQLAGALYQAVVPDK